METYNSPTARCARVCGYRAEKPKVQMKDPFIGPFEKKSTIIEPAHEQIGFPLVDYTYVYENGELKTIYSFPRYPVYFPTAEATYKRCWELREEASESDDKYRDAMRAHYDRVDPKEEKVYPEIDEEYFRPDPYNFYQRKQLCDGYKVIPRFCDNDYARMFVAEHHPGNPQHQTEFDYSDVETKDEEVDFMGVGTDSRGANKNEKAYWIGQVYIMNQRNGKRRSGWLIQKVATYFNVGLSTVQRNAKFADACNMLSEDGDGSKMANTIRKRAVKAAQIMSEEEFDWVLKPYDYNKRSKPWETFDGERGYVAKECALRI